MANRFSAIFNKIFRKPLDIPSTVVQSLDSQMTVQQIEKLRKLGAVVELVTPESIAKETIINFDRVNLYREIDRALEHPLVASAAEFFTEVACSWNDVNNATVWVEAENKRYKEVLDDLLDSIGLEERIYDWGYSTATYGDMFIKVNGRNGIGVDSVDDSAHPSSIARVDYEGKLLGFYLNNFAQDKSNEGRQLLAPWEYVHLRLLGTKKKRPLYPDNRYSEFRTSYILSPDNKQLTAKYGSSILINALGIYKRLRMAEDSLMISRISRSQLRYLIKVTVTGSNFEAASAIIDEYKQILKRSQALNTDPNTPFFSDKSWFMTAAEDIILPVFGDAANSVVVDKLGGDVDVKWIADIDELRNQLAVALRTPLQLIGGYQEDLPSFSGNSIEQLDIRFARSAKRLQRCLVGGIKRLCQIHLAYLGMDPDESLFEIRMNETSTAEEAQARENLDKGADVVQKVMDLISNNLPPNMDKLKILQYLNDKILKLNDLNFEDAQMKIGESKNKRNRYISENTDLISFLPLTDQKLFENFKSRREIDWSDKFGKCQINAKQVKTNG